METLERSPITGKEGSEFDYAQAVKWTKNHRDKHPGKTVSHFYGKEILQSLLDQPGCMGIRMYHAYDEVGDRHLMLVGVTEDGADMLPAGAKPGHLSGRVPFTDTELRTFSVESSTETSGGKVVQVATPCPGSAGCP